MAKYGVSALRLADAVRQLDPLGWLAEIHGLSTWPPVWPLVQSVAFLCFGADVSVARGLVAVCWALAVVAAFWAVRPLVPGIHGDAAGLMAAAWVAQAPLLQALATVNLLEVPGVLGLLVCLGCAARALDPEADTRRRARWWRVTWITSLLLFFLKYNYGLLWLAPLFSAELVRRRGSWRQLASWLWMKIRGVRWTPWTSFLTVALGALVVMRYTGGIDVEVLGRRLRATSVGNPAYVLLLLVCIRSMAGGKEAWRRLRRHWRAVDTSWHGLVSLLVAPILGWMLLPPHVKEFFGFVENRSSDLGFGASMAFYPRVFVEQYSSGQGMGWLVLALGAAAMIWLVSDEPRHRLLALTTVTAWCALWAHPYKLSRFGVQAAVLTGALASVWLVAVDGRRLRGAWVSVPATVAVLGVLALGVDRSFVMRQHEVRTVSGDSVVAAEEAARVALRDGIVLGTWNELSPGWVEWRARRAQTVTAGWRPVTTLDLDRRQRAEAVTHHLETGTCRPVAFIDPKCQGWLEENSWLEPVEARLRSASSRWRARPAAAGLAVFECRSGGDESVGRVLGRERKP